MFAAIHQFLHDLRWLVLLVTLPTAIFYGWRFYGLLMTPTQPKTAPIRRPGARPVPPKAATSTAGVQQNLLDKTTGSAPRAVGEESRKAKAQEPTIRIGSADQRPDSTPKHATADLLGRKSANDDDEVGALFAGLDDRLSPKDTPPKDVHARASRLEELGFHHSIPSDAPSAPSTPTETAGAKPSTPAADAAAPQLDDILARLDRVLGDEPAAASSAPVPTSAPAPDATATTPPAPPATPAASHPPPPKAPSWARADVTDEDLDAPVKTDDEGRQLGLFDRDKTDPGSKPS